MKIIKMILFTAVICVIALGAILPAYALAANSITLNAAPLAYSKTDWLNRELLFPKFDPALGTLVRMDLSITSGIETILTVTNIAALESSGNAKTHVIVTANDPQNLLTLQPDIYSPAFYYLLNAGEATTSTQLVNGGSAGGSYTDAGILGEFSGPGSIGLNVSTWTETMLAWTGGNTNASQVTNADAEGSVTYWYVPEPSSFVAMFMGLIGSAGLIKLRKRS